MLEKIVNAVFEEVEEKKKESGYSGIEQQMSSLASQTQWCTPLNLQKLQ